MQLWPPRHPRRRHRGPAYPQLQLLQRLGLKGRLGPWLLLSLIQCLMCRLLLPVPVGTMPMAMLVFRPLAAAQESGSLAASKSASWSGMASWCWKWGPMRLS